MLGIFAQISPDYWMFGLEFTGMVLDSDGKCYVTKVVDHSVATLECDDMERAMITHEYENRETQ